MSAHSTKSGYRRTSRVTQDRVFKQEGDRWFDRNRDVLDPAHDRTRRSLYTRVLTSMALRNKRILDIGCSNGFRLEYLRLRGANGWGIDPSPRAIKEGKKRYPKLHLYRGVSHNLARLKDNSFDIVLMSFVFHWIDRTKLLQTVSEIDRVLKVGGVLVIQDFAPNRPHKTRYAHVKDGVFTYKQEYGNIFLASGCYRLIKRRTFRHDRAMHGVGDHNSCAVAALQKTGDSEYPLRSLPARVVPRGGL